MVNYAGSADAALEAVVDVHPDRSAVGAAGLFGPEVTQGLHLPVLEEHLQVVFSGVEFEGQYSTLI